MDIPNTVLTILLLLGCGLVAEAVGRRLSFLPVSVWLIAAGALLAVAVEGLALDTGIRAHNFSELVFYVLLPVLIFEAAYVMPKDTLRKYLPTVLLAATFGLLIAAGITGLLIWRGIGHPGFPLMAALLTGALLAATDPVAVVNQFKQLGAPKELSTVMEGESLFNDATAVVLFSLLLSIMVATPGEGADAVTVTLRFATVFFGGILVGIGCGLLGNLLGRVLPSPIHASLITLLVAYSGFFIAEHWLHVSGVMAAFSGGITMSLLHQARPDPAREEHLHHFWETLGNLFNIVVFVLMGLVIHAAMFSERWLSMLIAIPAALIGRLVAIYISSWISRFLFRQQLTPRCEPVLVWGGLRGIVTVALALSLTHRIDQWFTIQSIAFGVVLFSLLVQAPLNPWLMRRLKII